MVLVKQIEVTTKVKQNINEINSLLLSKGFILIRRSRVEDRYMTQELDKLNRENVLDILQSCVLIRYLSVDNDYVWKGLTYKNKTYKDNIVISEEKISISIDDIVLAEKLFKALKFQKLIDVKYDVIVYKKDDLELAFQEVEGLGLLLEYENLNDFDGCSNEEVIKIKKEMLEEIKGYGIITTDDFDIKKSYQLVIERLK